jgi:hypothetical protein
MRKSKATPRWIFRLMFIFPGAVLAIFGLALLRQGVFWIAGYNARLGRLGYGPSLGYVGFGAIFLIIGLVPWPKDPGPLKKRDKWRTHI